MNEALKPQLLDPEDIADLVMVDREQVYLWMSEDKIPYADLRNGEFKIPLGGFQCVMHELFDLEADLEVINAAAAKADPEVIEQAVSRFFNED